MHMVLDGSKAVFVELWDFPGTIAESHAVAGGRGVEGGGASANQLVANFFHAAVICYSVEEERNVSAVAGTVSLLSFVTGNPSRS